MHGNGTGRCEVGRADSEVSPSASRLELGMGMRLAGAALLFGCAVWPAAGLGQTAAGLQRPTLTLPAELRLLGAAAESQRNDLPSFVCEETGLSQEIKKGKVKEHLSFVAEVRVEKHGEGRLFEDLEIAQVNGKRYSGGGFHPPFMVQGGFGESLFFFLPRTQACFNFKLSPGRIDFDSPAGTFERPECGETGAPLGFALLDEGGNITHLERQVPADYALRMHVVDFTAIDFAPVELDGKLYPLTSKVVADVPKDGNTLHFEANFTGCHLFKATIRVLPDITPVPGDESAAPHP